MSEAKPPRSQQQRARMSIKLTFFISATIVVLFVVASLVQKAMYDAFGVRYVFFRQQLTNLFYNVYISLTVLYLYCSSADAVLRLPWRHALLLAALDATADFLKSVAGYHTPGEYQTLVSNTSIFFTMIVSYFVVRARYTRAQVLGATVVVAGTAVAALAHFDGAAKHVAQGSFATFSVLLFTAAFIPAAFSAVLKQLYAQRDGVNIFFVSFACSWLQLLLSWAFYPIMSLPAFGGTPLRDLPSVLRDGALCFAGDARVPVLNEHAAVVGHCGAHVPLVTMVYSVSGFVVALLSLYLTLRESATAMVIVQASALPLANLLFAVHFVMRSQTEPFSYADVVALVLVLAGFLLYSSDKLRRSSGAHEKAPLLHTNNGRSTE